MHVQVCVMSCIYRRENLTQKTLEQRVKSHDGVKDPFATYKKSMTDRSFSDVTSEQPATAALGAGRIAELKSQLLKSKVTTKSTSKKY